MRRRLSLAVLALLVATAALAAGAGARGQDVRLSLVAYSTPRDAYAKIIPLFQKTPQGQGVSFTQSYGASGDQARAVQNGLKADIVALSLAPDVDQLVKTGLVDANWSKQSYKGIVTDSVVVFAVRDGNPKHIKTWNDLLKPGVSVITPNPFTSGGARWNVMAAYGSWIKQGKTPKQAQANLLELFQNVSVQDSSARNALNTFLSGKGDVLLTYENEAIAAQLAKQPVQYVIPRSTILIENPVAVTKDSADKDTANAFLRFLRTPAAQQVFADYGYRPIVKSVFEANRRKFPSRPGLFTIDQLGLGGWSKVQSQFFDPDRGILAGIERKVGGVTG
jgi:sulfate/thiosulfate transport system substrate-binding protein